MGAVGVPLAPAGSLSDARGRLRRRGATGNETAAERHSRAWTERLRARRPNFPAPIHSKPDVLPVHLLPFHESKDQSPRETFIFHRKPQRLNIFTRALVNAFELPAKQTRFLRLKEIRLFFSQRRKSSNH